MTKAWVLALSWVATAATIAPRSAWADVTSPNAGPPTAGPPAATAPAPASTSAMTEPERPPVLGYVFLGVGAAALATGAFLGVKQQLEYNDLENTCAPRCAKSDTDAIADQRIAAGISGAVGAVLIVVGAILVVRTKSSSVAIGAVPGGGGGIAWSVFQ